MHAQKSSLATAFLAVLFLLAGQAQSAKIHKWVDEDGNTHYSEVPPPEAAETTVIPPAPPPADNPDQLQRNLDAQIKRLDEARDARQKHKQETEKTRIEAESQRAECRNARDRLRQLETFDRVLVTEPDGSTRRLPFEELEARRKQLRAEIAENCESEN